MGLKTITRLGRVILFTEDCGGRGRGGGYREERRDGGRGEGRGRWGYRKGRRDGIEKGPKYHFIEEIHVRLNPTRIL